ncbi:Lipoprotein OS=Streptomyces violarus OX=67380 GN=FHS41_006473 PE=4 SV=1 [Streptomyces violarus]
MLLAHGRSSIAAARVEELYGLLVAAEPADADQTGQAVLAPLAVSGELLTVPGGTLWHRADCPLVAGKAEAVPVDSKLVASGELGPCPICEPAEETD